VVEVLIEEMFRSDRNRSKDYERAVVVEAEVKRNTKTTLRSERRSLLKKSLTGPTLLEMSGNPTNQELTPVIWVKRFSSGKVIGIYALAYRNDLLATG
jgi:hypothetical protein